MTDYRRPHKKTLPKRSRTRPVPGRWGDKGRYFRCWNCNWICDSQRDELGGSDSTAGDDHTDYHGIANEDPYTENAGRVLCLGGDIGHYHVAMRVGPDDEPKTIRHNLTSEISKGCPFCGTTNWRGDY
jgi:hypothetical protein